MVLDRHEEPRAGLECAGAFVSSVVAGVCQEVQNPELLLDGEAPVCWMMKLSLKQHPGFWHERLYFPDVSFVRWEGDSESLVPVQRCRKTGWGLWLDRKLITAPPEVLGSSEGDADPGESSWTDRFHRHGRRV